MAFLSATLAALAAAAAPPTGPQPLQPPVAWVADSDYPAGAIRREVSGIVGFRLEVGADGRPTGCTITQPADPDLDATTCRIFMDRARFAPARDRRGRPVAGTYSNRLRWIIPDDSEPMPFEPVHVANVLTLDAAGNLVCAWSRNGSPPAPRSMGECGFLEGSGAEAALRGRGRPGTLILVYELTPEGMAPAPGNEQAGADLVYEDTAQIVLAADGTLAECRPGDNPVRSASLPLRPPMTACGVANGMRAAAASGAPQRGFIAIRIYLRASAAR